ncbi:MAG: YraN family protein [bacterium]
MMSRRQQGMYGEKVARVYLSRKGFRILEKNVRTPFGEIDLVCLDGACLVFVEVKYRRSARFGRPEEAITHCKLDHLMQSALSYVADHSWNGEFRIDVLAILRRSGTLRLRHFWGVGKR